MLLATIATSYNKFPKWPSVHMKKNLFANSFNVVVDMIKDTNLIFKLKIGWNNPFNLHTVHIIHYIQRKRYMWHKQFLISKQVFIWTEYETICH